MYYCQIWKLNTLSLLSLHPLITSWFLPLAQTNRKPEVMGAVWVQSLEVSLLGYGGEKDRGWIWRTDGEHPVQNLYWGIWEGFSGQCIKGAILGALEYQRF